MIDINLNTQLFKCLINLDTFSRLSPNTYIHLSKSNYFVPTAGKLSGVIFAQIVSNYYNYYTMDQLSIDFNLYAKNIITIVNSLYNYIINNNDENYKLQIASKIILIYREFKYARGNDIRGLICMLKTYENTNIYNKLLNSYDYIGTNLTKYKNLIKYLIINKFKHSIEYTFTDDDWELYLKNSQYLQYETTSLYKFYMLYTSSLFFNQFMNNIGLWNWYDKIYEKNNVFIMLGALPIKTNVLGIETRNDLYNIKELGVSAVLSVVESFENNSEGFIFSPISPQEWEKENIKYFQLPIPDFCEIPIKKIYTCVEYINWNIKNNRSVYIHCRVGRHRSSLIVMAYMIKYLNYTSENVYHYVKNHRCQVQNGHHKTLQLFEREINKK